GDSFNTLSVEDGTRGLARSGLVRFLPPADARPLMQFGRTRFWLRARSLDASFAPMPVLGLVSTNTMWADHAHEVRMEVLGGSSGARDQTFKLSQTSILDGLELEVAEPEPPPPAELLALQELEGDDVVTVETAASGAVTVWVRWHAVADFFGSGPRDRHYTL